jgi:hypothetical protein
LPTPKQKIAEVLLASKLPSDWFNLYTAKADTGDDPSLRHSKHVVQPYDWKDAPYDPEREPRALEVIDRACDFGIEIGVCRPYPKRCGKHRQCLDGRPLIIAFWTYHKMSGSFAPFRLPADHFRSTPLNGRGACLGLV